MAQGAAVPAPGSVAAAFRSPEAAVAASGSVAEALRGAKSNVVASRNVAGALQERCVAQGSSRRKQTEAQAVTVAGVMSNRRRQLQAFAVTGAVSNKQLPGQETYQAQAVTPGVNSCMQNSGRVRCGK